MLAVYYQSSVGWVVETTGRGGAGRLHPRSELFAFEPPPEEPGDSPTTPANGWSVGLIPGVEIRLNDSLALDVSGYFNYFKVSEYDLSPVGLPNASSGSSFEAMPSSPAASTAVAAR